MTELLLTMEFMYFSLILQLFKKKKWILRSKLHQMEIVSGPFERRVEIPIPFDRTAVSAHLADGFLTVTLPKRNPHSVKVKTK